MAGESDSAERPAGAKLPAAEAMDLAGLVAQAPHAIVSRTIAEKPHATMTLFAFDKGQALSEHSAPFDAYVLILAGRAELVIGGRPVGAAAGQAVLMPANVPHAVTAVEPFKMLLIMLR